MRNKKRHILLVTSEFPPQPGGIGNHAYNLAKHLYGEGIGVEVISDQRSLSGKEENTFDGLLKFKVHRVGIRKFRWLMYFKRIILLFRKIGSVDTVIASGKFSLWIVAFSSLFYKRKFIAVIHGSEVNFTNKGLKLAINASLNRFSKLIAVSQYTKDLVGHIHHDIIVIPNGIDSEKFEDGTLQSIDVEGQPSLLTVGNVTDRKGQLNVIHQLPMLLQTYPNLHYHCIGLPTQKDDFVDLARTLEVEAFVTFHGCVSDEFLEHYYRASDIFVMLSSETATGDVEGFGIAIIEANYFGLPCIGAKGCGIEDAINDYKSGRLIAPLDGDALKMAMADILSDYDCYSKHAKSWALQHSWTTIVKHYIVVLES